MKKWLLTLFAALNFSLIVNSQSSCANSDFSFGDFTNWQGFYGYFYNPSQYPGFVYDRHVALSTPGFFDPFTDYLLFSLPPGGTHAARLGNSEVGAEAEQLRYSLTVTPENDLFIYQYAVVLEDPDHDPEEQPSFTIEVFNSSGTLIDPVCGYYYVYAQQGMPGWVTYNSVVWKDWTIVGLNLNLWMGQTITIVFTTRDCEQTGHFGYAYLAATCGRLHLQVDYCVMASYATLTAPSGFTYLWSTGQTSQSILINNPTAGAEYNCLLTAVNGCQVTIFATVYATVVTADFSVENNCAGLPVNFYDLSTTNQNEIVNRKWLFGDGIILETDQADTSHVYVNHGTYQVTMISFSSDGCSDTISKQVTIFPVPVTDFTYIPKCKYDSIPFQDNSAIIQGSIETWKWDFGDGSLPISGNTAPLHFYQNAGTYNASLITISNNSCTDTLEQPVVVYAVPDIKLFQDEMVITEDTIVLCPLDSIVNLSVSDCGISYQWTKKSESTWLSTDQMLPLSNPGMGFFVESYYLKVINSNDCLSKDTIHVLWDFTGCVGISEYNPVTASVYPNPVNDVLYVEFLPGVTVRKINLFDSHGICVYTQEFAQTPAGSLSISTKGLSPGLYFLSVISKEKSETIKILLL